MVGDQESCHGRFTEEQTESFYDASQNYSFLKFWLINLSEYVQYHLFIYSNIYHLFIQHLCFTYHLWGTVLVSGSGIKLDYSFQGSSG